ncbi:MAG: NAD-dependent deacylase [Nitrospirae bacterium]|nr:NAD-dependent deacylase [Nitrospirota bacterium]
MTEAAGRLSACRRIVVFTGAGVSAESGIPTFRGEGGIWEKYDPDVFGNIPGLGQVWLTQPQRLLDFITDALDTFLAAQPNAAHLVIGKAEAAGRIRAVVTQNVDDLHERGGTRTVFKLHGDLYTLRCLRCGRSGPLDRGRMERIRDQLDGMRSGRLAILKKLWEIMPRCGECEGLTRPDVVFFGESLPANVLRQAEEETRSCDAFLIVGTSGVVYPAALLPKLARSRGALVVEVNREASPYTEMSDFSFFGPAGSIVPELIPESPRPA